MRKYKDNFCGDGSGRQEKFLAEMVEYVQNKKGVGLNIKDIQKV